MELIIAIYFILIFLDVFGTIYLMFYFNGQEIKYLTISGEKYEKLFEKTFLYGVVIIPFINDVKLIFAYLIGFLLHYISTVYCTIYRKGSA